MNKRSMFACFACFACCFPTKRSRKAPDVDPFVNIKSCESSFRGGIIDVAAKEQTRLPVVRYAHHASNAAPKTKPKPVVVHRSASFSVNPKTPYTYNAADEMSYKGGNEDIINATSKEPLSIGRTGRVYVLKMLTREKDKLLKKLLFPEQYRREKSLVNEICTGKCKYIMGRCEFYDTLQVICMPKYSMDVYTYVYDNGALSEPDAKNMCMNVCLGLFYIHTKGYVYGDLKTENVCIKNGDISHPVIIDIGSCHRNRPSITIDTASPEALRGEPLTHRHDTWTLGIFFMELTTDCVVNPSRIRSELDGWYEGSTDSMNFLRAHPLFESCTRFDKEKRICNFFNLRKECTVTCDNDGMSGLSG